jgi:uncharacterized protein (TIGR02246 family)
LKGQAKSEELFMDNDEKAIRALVDQWLTATKAGDLNTVLKLMTDDVLFMVPGQEPFGKAKFAANSAAMKNFKIEGTSDIQELKVLGDWAWMRNFLKVTITPLTGAPIVHSGYTLTILRKNSDGSWVLFRDANMVGPERHS